MVSELKSDRRDTVDWDRKWLVNFNTRKTQLVSFDLATNSGAINGKMEGSVLGLPFCSKLDGSSYLFASNKTISKKIGVLIRSMKIFPLEISLEVAPSCYFDMLGKIQKPLCKFVGQTLAVSLEPLDHFRNADSLRFQELLW